MTGGVGQVGGNAMSLRPEMPAVAAISHRRNPGGRGRCTARPARMWSRKPGTPGNSGCIF